MLRNLDIVIAIDTQNILDQVGLALHIDTICGHYNRQNALLLSLDLNLQSCDDRANGLFGDLLTNQCIHSLQRHIETERSNRFGIEVNDLRRDLTARQITEHQRSTLQGIDRTIGIDTALETERRIGIQAVTLSSLAHPNGIEICALDEDVGRSIAHTRLQTAKYACDTHRFICVADHQILSRQLALNAIERYERSALLASANHNLATLDLIGIECVQRLTKFEQDIVGDIDQIVLGIDTHSTQRILQPLGRRSNLTTRNRHTGITRSRLLILNLDLDFQIVVINRELVNRRPSQFNLLTVCSQICCQIARNTDMRRSVDTVRCQTNTNQIVVLDIQVLLCRHTNGSIFGQLFDTIVIGTDTQLIIGAKHTERFNATNLALLDFETLGFAHRIEYRANSCAQHLQSCTYIRSTADDIQRLVRTNVNGSYVQMVRIGMIDTSQHLADNNACQAATNSLDLLELLDFKTYICQNFSDLLGREIGFQITFKPIIRDIHRICVYLFCTNCD